MIGPTPVKPASWLRYKITMEESGLKMKGPDMPIMPKRAVGAAKDPVFLRVSWVQ